MHVQLRIKELLGDGSTKTTEIYTHVSNISLANIKSPLDHIIEQQSNDNGEKIIKPTANNSSYIIGRLS
jgi:hypothetical protein